MTSAQKEAHARMLSSLPTREHIKMFNVQRVLPISIGGARTSGRKGKIAAGSVPIFRRKKKL